VKNILTKQIWLHLHSPIEIVCGCKLQRDHLMSVGKSNYRRSCCPHNVQGNGRNMRERAKVLFYRLGLLLVGEGTSSSSFRGAILVGGVGGSHSKVHLGEEERMPAARRKKRMRVLMTESSDTKLRIIGRLNLMVSQPFLYICVGQYTIVMVKLQYMSMTTIFPI